MRLNNENFEGVLIDTMNPVELDTPQDMSIVDTNFFDNYTEFKENIKDYLHFNQANHSFYFNSPKNIKEVINYAMIVANQEIGSVGLTFNLLQMISTSDTLKTYHLEDNLYLTSEDIKGRRVIIIHSMPTETTIEYEWFLIFEKDDWKNLIKFINLLTNRQTNKIDLAFKSKLNTTTIIPTIKLKEEGKEEMKLNLYEFYIKFISIMDKGKDYSFYNDLFFKNTSINSTDFLKLESTMMQRDIKLMSDYMIAMLVNQIIFSDFLENISFSKLSDFKNKFKYSIFYNKKYISKQYLY